MTECDFSGVYHTFKKLNHKFYPLSLCKIFGRNTLKSLQKIEQLFNDI